MRTWLNLSKDLPSVTVLLSARPAQDSSQQVLGSSFFSLPSMPKGSRLNSKAAAAAKSLQSCPTLCDPIVGSPPGSPIPGILQARTLEWVAISFTMHESEKWKWSHLVVSDSSRPHGLQPTRLLCPWDFPGKNTGVGCHCLVHQNLLQIHKEIQSVPC